MPIEEHTVFNKPDIGTTLWRYMDLPKFVNLLTSQSLWLTNAEVLSKDDPHEVSLSTAQFRHRQWSKLEDVPDPKLTDIVKHYGSRGDGGEYSAFKAFMMEQEQLHLYTQYWRRSYYIGCWHGASHESLAMWKIYAAPGPGVAVISNSARMTESLSQDDRKLYLGAVNYFDERTEQIDWSNAFNIVLSKRQSFSFEQEVRLVYWDFEDMQDPVDMESWSDETMRFESVNTDTRPVSPGVAIDCNLEALIEKVVISPFAPPWYRSTIESLRDQLGLKFPIESSNLLDPPPTVS
ncbi:MAG: hypothetical protein AAGE37_03630 [Pseudomonadota bacterium]